MTGFSGLNSVGEEESTMLKIYRGPLRIYSRWHELPQGSCRSADLRVVPSRGEEHDVRDTICLYKDTLRDDVIEFGYPLLSIRTPSQLQLEIAGCVFACNAR